MTEPVITPEPVTPVAPITQVVPVIDYKAEHEKLQEQLKKFEGVDLEKWNKAKEFDFEKAEKAIQSQESREQEEREAQEEKDREEAEKDPVTGLKKEVEGIKDSLAKKEAAERERVQNDWMDKFNKSIDNSIDEALKTDSKDLEELSPQEKKYVVAIVNQLYEVDASQKVPKLNLTTISKVVSDVMKEVKENRTFLAGKKIRNQSHPAIPSSQDGVLPSTPKTDGERLEAMVNFYKAEKA